MSFITGVREFVNSVRGISPDLTFSKAYAGGVGLTPDYQAFRNTFWGQAQPVNYRFLWKIYVEDPVVFGCIQTTADAIIGNGWKLEKGVKLHRKELEEFLRENHFDSMIRDLVTSLLIYGDAYIELVRGDASIKGLNSERSADSLLKTVQAPPALRKRFSTELKESDNEDTEIVKAYFVDKDSVGKEEYDRAFQEESGKPFGLVREIYPRDSTSIRIDYNEHGEPIKYIQRVLHRRVDFYPDEMIHLRLNVTGNRQYGHSGLRAVVQTIITKLYAEQYTSDWFRRSAMPRTVWYLPRYYSPEQEERFRKMLAQVQPQEDIVVRGEETKNSQIASSNADMQFKELLLYLSENILIAMQVPPVLVGITESANRSSAQQQMEAFDRRIDALKREIAEMLNLELFNSENFNFSDVEFHFENKNSREELKYAQIASLLGTLNSSATVTKNEIRSILNLPPIEEVQSELDAEQEKKVEAQSALMESQGGFNAGGKNEQGKFGASPKKSEQKAKNREHQNVDQQIENKAFLREKVKRITKAIDLARIESQGVSLDRVGEFAKALEFNKSREYWAELESAKLNSQGKSIWREHKDMAREINEYERQSVKEEMQRDSSERVLQGSNSLDPRETNTTNVGGQKRYPYGATPILERELAYARGDRQVKQDEVKEVQHNDAENSFSLNSERVFPKDEKDKITDGKPQPEEKEKKRKGRAKQGPERDEVNQLGITTWAANDKEDKASFRSKRYVGYDGTDQLTEGDF